MEQLFLTSNASKVLSDIVKHLPLKPSEYNFAFINTATETREEHTCVINDKNKMVELGFNVDEFSITGMNLAEIKEKMKDKNGVFLCGGNPLHLLDQMIKTGFDKVLLDRIEKGLVCIGSSAGSMIFGNDLDLANVLDAKSTAPDLKSNGFKILDLVIFPHWGNDDMKDLYYNGFDALYNRNSKLVFLRDNQYVYFNGDNYIINQIS